MAEFADLNNKRDFPSFSDCPTEYQFHDYYHSRLDPKTWFVDRHWCLLGEIKSVDRPADSNNGYSCTIYDGSVIIQILFDFDHPEHFNPDHLNVGHTVAILYAHICAFKDGQLGICADHSAEALVIPAGLDSVKSAGSEVRQHHNGVSKKKRKCHSCGRTAKLKDLESCPRCGLFWYCNSACQLNGWMKKGHQETCRLVQDHGFKSLLQLDFGKFICRFEFERS